MSGDVLPSAKAQAIAWANEFIEVVRVQAKAQGRNLRGGTADWWARLDDALRCFLLAQCAPDDWERYMSVPWASLPDGLRSCVGIEARATMRRLEGCSWR
ncbi:hypothetical protein [Variovorax arabinosiphilus]|uniref:hypothetical protein n=1 Tax=Variovorax arabinosiphilus TaxID=3053498 RepID=UPI0025757667|nr:MULTISPECIES: hypothetical protein [unclassified Variovorax]MDM0119018.1 hypothetical protein [Variovorax sp. J2L1-78]MDM0129444.1 hypothetical protein [Variovorax sp. J2L1-63]MDM0232770.1 hypothetical protein [Variovorax sp. J2R1-6]